MTRGTRKEAHRRDGEFQFLCVWMYKARAANSCDGESDPTAMTAAALVGKRRARGERAEESDAVTAGERHRVLCDES